MREMGGRIGRHEVGGKEFEWFLGVFGLRGIGWSGLREFVSI